jgi:hypothetical protein
MEAVDAPAADVQVEAPAGPAQLHAADDSDKELQFINICLTDINAKRSCEAADIAHASLAQAIGNIAEEHFAPTWNALSCTVAQKIAAFTDDHIARYECIESIKEVRDRCHLFVSYNLMRYTRQKQQMKVSARILHTIHPQTNYLLISGLQIGYPSSTSPNLSPEELANLLWIENTYEQSAEAKNTHVCVCLNVDKRSRFTRWMDALKCKLFFALYGKHLMKKKRGAKKQAAHDESDDEEGSQNGSNNDAASNDGDYKPDGGDADGGDDDDGADEDADDTRYVSLHFAACPIHTRLTHHNSSYHVTAPRSPTAPSAPSGQRTSQDFSREHAPTTRRPRTAC